MDSKELLQLTVEAADDKRADDIVALDVAEVSLMADYFVILSADSKRQVQAIADNIVDFVRKAGSDVKSVEGRTNFLIQPCTSNGWILSVVSILTKMVSCSN